MPCPLCGEEKPLIFNNRWASHCVDACEHGACQECLQRHVERHSNGMGMQTGQHQLIPCYVQGCQAHIPPALSSRYARPMARAVLAFSLKNARLGPVSDLVTRSQPCSECGSMSNPKEEADAQQAWFQNPKCGHVACETCWRKSAHEQLETCMEQKRARPDCLARNCSCTMDKLLWQHLCKESVELHDWSSRVNAEILRLKRVDALRIQEWEKPGTPGPKCPECGKHHFALFQDPACGHMACEDCWGRCALEAVTQCREGKRLRGTCVHPGCTQKMAEGIWRHACSRSAPAAGFLREMDSEVRRLERTARDMLRWAPEPCDDGPICAVCGERQLALLESPDCKHIACETCWTKHAEGRLQACQHEHRMRPMCMERDCACVMSSEMWHHLCQKSKLCKDFHNHATSELTRLSKVPAAKAKTTLNGPGPVCPKCEQHKFVLFEDPDCGEAACEDCWGAAAERQISWCEEGLRLRGKCSNSCCGRAMPEGLWRHACSRTSRGTGFLKTLDSTLARLRKTAQTTLQFPEEAWQPGPTCSVCREQHLALISSGPCGHAICEDCWGGWAAANLDSCRWSKCADLRCFAEGCQEVVVPEVWSHACTRSEAVQGLEKEFAYRRRLQNNVLFPAEVQVQCPQPGCLGIGYLGSDTVMCFVCEHSWNPVEELIGNPEDAEGTLDALKAKGECKACPQCGANIIKNGGCDHMTCRCKYEFYWSNLRPYGNAARRPAVPAPPPPAPAAAPAPAVLAPPAPAPAPVS